MREEGKALHGFSYASSHVCTGMGNKGGRERHRLWKGLAERDCAQGWGMREDGKVLGKLCPRGHDHRAQGWRMREEGKVLCAGGEIGSETVRRDTE